MIDRDVPPLLRDGADLPDLLREALETATDDELPNGDRMNRLKGELAAAIALGREQRASSPRVSGWRPAAHQRHIRFAATKIGVAALMGMGAAWSGVEGYRVYREGIARAAIERPPPMPAIEPRRSARSVTAPSPHETPNVEASPSDVADPILIGPPVVTRSESSPKLSTKLNSVPGADPPSPPPNIATARPPLLEEDLLERATQALRRDPAEALALADEHARTFAGGRLVQEREVVAIQALSKLARFDAASARAKRFLERYASSPYAKDLLRFANAGAAR
jgi:hypothetical protein